MITAGKIRYQNVPDSEEKQIRVERIPSNMRNLKEILF